MQITAILNEEAYQDTATVCGADGAKCFSVPNNATVCSAMQDGTLIPGADVISGYNPDAQSGLAALISNIAGKPALTVCPKAPYTGCMTAPCKITQSRDAECSCPIFWGIFQLGQADAQRRPGVVGVVCAGFGRSQLGRRGPPDGWSIFQITEEALDSGKPTLARGTACHQREVVNPPQAQRLVREFTS